jgi:hypothetical protein
MSCVLIFIALEVEWFGGGLYPPLYSLGGQSYMEILDRYLLRSPIRVLFRYFPSVPISPTLE